MSCCRMKLFALVFFASLNIISAQDSTEELIKNIFSTNGTFLDNYEEITPPPLKSIGALTKCGEGEQINRFVCVPYYNCNPNTKIVEQNPDIDGTNKINIRLGEDEEPKCDHYLEICCKVPDPNGSGGNGGGNGGENGGGNGGGNTGEITTPPTQPTSTPTPITSPPVTPAEDTGSNQEGRTNTTRSVNCGIRNSAGLDFNFRGTNEAKFGEFPWMVALLKKNPRLTENLAICGGSLIGPRVILTGAHCVEPLRIGDIKVRGGEWDTQTQNERIPYQERNVARKIIHEHYTKGNLYNDIALLILDRPFTKSDNIGTICLPAQNQHYDSRECFATGWGKDIFGKEGRYAVILKKIQLPLVQNRPCQTALRKTRLKNSFVLHRSFICAGGEANLDTCTGDGGSPLVCPDPSNPNRYLQVGTVAWGIGCGENNVPGVYGDVANFRDWIDTKLQELGININSYIL